MRDRLRGWAHALAGLRPRAAILPSLGLLVLWWVWRFEPFYHVGMATGDQLGFSIAAFKDFWGGVVGIATAQGRVYDLFTNIVHFGMAARPDRIWRSVFNIIVFGLSPLCFAFAAFRSNGARLLYGWLFASVAWAGFHHMPPAAYPSVNHLSFFYWPLAATLVRWRSRHPAQRLWPGAAVFGCLAFASFVAYEPITALSFCVFAWLVYCEPEARLKRALWIALGIAAACYAAIYLGWRVVYPPSYEGVQHGSLSPLNIARIVLAYSVGALPFCSAYFWDTPFAWEELAKGGTSFSFQASASLDLTVFALLLTALALINVGTLYARERRACAARADNGSNADFGAARTRAAWLFCLLCLLAINGPLGLSIKYQHWVAHLDETYATSQTALYPLVMAATLALRWSYQSLRLRGVPVAFCALLAGVAWISLPIRQHNVVVTNRQRASLARWDGVTALAAYASYHPATEVVAPDFFYSVFTGNPNWARYWRQYMKLRFGHGLVFHPRRGPGMDDVPTVRLHRSEDGGLRAVTIQTRESVSVVAAPENLPSLLFAGDGQGAALAWQQAETLAPSRFLMLTLTDQQLLGLGKNIEPVWVLPSAAAALP